MSRFTWAGGASSGSQAGVIFRPSIPSLHKVNINPHRSPACHLASGENRVISSSAAKFSKNDTFTLCGYTRTARDRKSTFRTIYVQCSALDESTGVPESSEVSQQGDGQSTILQRTENLEKSSGSGRGTKKERIKKLKEKSAARATMAATGELVMYPPDEQRRIKNSWARLMRWSRNLRQREAARANEVRLEKVVVFGGGSFGTAMGVCSGKVASTAGSGATAEGSIPVQRYQ